MKIVEVRDLAIPDVKAVRFARFRDARGYFTEPFRRSDLKTNPLTAACFRDVIFQQLNESLSRGGVVRGLHFQWNPFMGKLVRAVSGHMVDIVVDIRKGSPTHGMGFMHDMPADPAADSAEWIWVPPGFAHGNHFVADTVIEYLCSGEYSQGFEAGIAPYAPDIDWSLCDPALKARFDGLSVVAVMTDKDRNALTLSAWNADPRSEHFIHGSC